MLVLALLLSTAAWAQPPVDTLYPIVQQAGRSAMAQYDYARALTIFQLSIDLAEQMHNPLLIARSYGDVGQCHYRMGNAAKALEAFDKAMPAANAAHDPYIEGVLWQRISNTQRFKGNLSEALTAGQNAVALFRQAGNLRDVAGQTMNNGLVVRAMGDSRAGAAIFREAYDLAEAQGEKAIMRSALRNLSSAYWGQGDNEVALSFLERAMAIKEPPQDAPSIATNENILGLILYSLKRYPESKAALERGLTQARKAHDVKLEVNLLSAHSNTLRALNDLRGSVADLLRMQELATPLGLDRERVHGLGDLAERYVELNDPESALKYAREGVALSRKLNTVELSWWPLYGAGRAYTALGRKQEAEAAYKESIAILEQWNALSIGGDTEGIRFFEMRGSAYYGLLSLKLSDRDAEAALDLAERMKARRLSDVLAAGHAHITQAMSPAEKEREQKLSREVARLNQAMAGTGASNPKVKADFDAASRALEGFRAELYSAHPELQVHRGDARPVRVPELRDLLPDTHTLLIEFASLDDKIAIFTVERGVDGLPKLGLHQITADTDDVARRVVQYRDSLASRDPEYRAAAQKLYRMLLAPAAAQLAGKSNVVIVPDGPLWNLPFHALVDESGRHLIERFAVSYAPSLTVLRESLQSKPVNGKLLAIGSPRGDLPNAAAEARELGRLYGQESSVLTGKDATDARWREAAPQSSILHLATHGILNSAKPMFSYLELAGGDVIEARSLLDLELHASLAVLSGCETARGELRSGEGVVGLAWAMMVAGVPSVVVSEWKVDSARTTQLMLAFHRGLRSGTQSKAAALRNAAIETMKRPQYRHPFYWAGFHLLGNGQ